jgi:hypothetical protein
LRGGWDDDVVIALLSACEIDDPVAEV